MLQDQDHLRHGTQRRRSDDLSPAPPGARMAAARSAATGCLASSGARGGGTRYGGVSSPGSARLRATWAAWCMRFCNAWRTRAWAEWNTERIEGLDVVLRLALKQEGVPERELGSAHARVMQGLRGVLADPRARWILGSEHQEARSEYRLTGELDGAFVNVALDRTFVDRHAHTLDCRLQDRHAPGRRCRGFSRPRAGTLPRATRKVCCAFWLAPSRVRSGWGSTSRCSTGGGSGKRRSVRARDRLDAVEEALYKGYSRILK